MCIFEWVKLNLSHKHTAAAVGTLLSIASRPFQNYLVFCLLKLHVGLY